MNKSYIDLLVEVIFMVKRNQQFIYVKMDVFHQMKLKNF
jgi:hypothetical protein